MPFTQSELDALRRAFAKGVLEVSYDGQVVKYASGADLQKRIAKLEADLGQKSRGLTVATPGFSKRT